MTTPENIHLVITTHTASLLRLTLLGAAHQIMKPASVIVSCDVLDESIADCAARAASEFQFDLLVIQRAHQGMARPAQARNNAVRWLAHTDSIDHSLLIFLDGDCIAPPNLVHSYRRLCVRGDVIIGGRVELTAEQTASINEHAITQWFPLAPSNSASGLPLTFDRAQLERWQRRSRRTRRQAWLRRLHLTKSHKPKLVSANFAVSSEVFTRINGFDEEFEGWGAEDDDFVRRAYASGAQPVAAVTDAVVLHQHHLSRFRGAWHDNPSARRFLSGGPTKCVHGLDNPRPQDAPEVRLIRSSGLMERVC